LYRHRVLTPEVPLGLRERKNRQTQRAIVQAATDLILEGGYAAATIPRIAERADVSPRTVSTWFPAKDDILFDQVTEAIEHARQHLRLGPGSVVDRIEAWIADEAARGQPDPEISRLRDVAIAHDPELRARAHRHLDEVQSEIAAAVARDTGLRADEVGPQAFAGAVLGFLFALRSLGLEGHPDGPAQLAAGYALLRAALATMEPTPS
jgi:AcrR family transcriptional regulator